MRRFRNTATVEQPEAKNVTINQPPPGRAGEYFVIGGLILIGSIILWNVAIHVLSEMGFRRPVASAGWGLLYFAVFLALVYIPTRAFEKIVGMILAHLKESKRMESETRVQLERLQLQRLQALPVGSSRTLGEDRRRALIIQAVMARAYQFIELNKRNYQHNDSKPWAWKNIQGLQIEGEKPVSEGEARLVRTWLQEAGLIVGDKVNLEKYPSIEVFNRWLRMTFELPIVYGGSLPSSAGDRGYVPINENL